MAKTTFSEANIGKPSPLWYRTIRSVIYLLVFPVSLMALTLFAPEIVCSQVYGFIIILVIILTEVIGMFLNDGSEYVQL
jgi:hypothetical protein